MSLSTITFTGTLNRTRLPVDDMRLAAELAEELGDPLEFTVDCDQSKRSKRRKGDDGTDGAGGTDGKRFRYQLPLKRRGKSLKLFHNGSVHATGCTSPLEFLDMMQALCGFMASAGNVDAWLIDFDIQLINTLFLVTCPLSGRPLTIAPGALLKKLGSESRADFDTERHPSVKIPLLLDDGRKAATVCVFQTGSVSIMGAKRPAHVAAAYDMVCTALDAHAQEVCSPDTVAMRTTTAKHGLILTDGYPFNLHSCCQF